MTNDLLTLILGIFRLSLTLLYRMPFCNPIHDPRVTYFDCSRTRTTHNTNRCSHIHTSHTHTYRPFLCSSKKKKKITNESSTQFRLLAVTVCTFHNSQCLSVCRSIVVHRVCVCICRSPLFFIMHFAYTCSFHQL